MAHICKCKNCGHTMGNGATLEEGDYNYDKLNRMKLASEILAISRIPMTDQMRDSLREAAEWLRGDYDGN